MQGLESLPFRLGFICSRGYGSQQRALSMIRCLVSMYKLDSMLVLDVGCILELSW